MVLSDFLSRQKTDDSNPHEIVPIPFSLRQVLHENYYRINDLTRTIDMGTDKYLVQTRSQTKSSDIKVPEFQGANKDLITHVKPEWQKPVAIPTTCPTPPMHHLRPTHQTQSTDQRLPTNVVPPIPKPRMGQGRAGISRKPNITPPISKPISPIPTPAPKISVTTA